MTSLRLRTLDALSDLPGAEWDALVEAEADRAMPFLRHAFLRALEECGCATRRTGWRARHVTAWRGDRLVGAAPAYVRDRSDGDFGRDWDWAAAAERAGIGYYPKLAVTVPFTPATGRRLLVAAGEDRTAVAGALVDGLRGAADDDGCRSVHVLFPGSPSTRAQWLMKDSRSRGGNAAIAAASASVCCWKKASRSSAWTSRS